MAASPVGLFVAHLRLLDLDRRDDWPGLTIHTFSARAADQKQRIRGTEWALFRLFDLWDPADTARRLRPFFPPLEPLQSLNLRQALFRWLAELKKTGVLGRESLLRKTMLDECKGDKLFELLALFAAAVLRKVLASRPPSVTGSAVARTLATAPTLPRPELPLLLPLAVAHRAALARLLRRKDEKRARFARFAATLDEKAGDMRTRTRRCIDTPRAHRPPVAPRDADALKRQLAANWIGDQKWLAVILHGDHVQPGDAFLSNRFDHVWHTVERGRSLQHAAPEPGLLEDLQSRVHDQQTRLHRWKTFHDDLRRHNTKDAPVASTSNPPAPTTALTFDTHLQHQLPSNHTEHAVQRAPLRSTYRDILSDMDTELSRLSQSKPLPVLASLRRRTSSASAPRSPVRARPPPKQTRTSPNQTRTSPNHTRTSPNNTRTSPNHTQTSPAWHIEPKTLFTEPKTLVREQKALFEGLSAASSNLYLRPAKATESTPHSPFRRRIPEDAPRLSRTASTRTRSSSPLSSDCSAPSQPTPLDPPDLLADQIISAIDNATPSPVKRPQPRMSMSLVDRTRMTLSRTPSFDPVVESPDLPAPAFSIPAVDTSATQALLERTRQTMASVSRAPSLRTKSKSSSRPKTQPIESEKDDLDALDEAAPGATTPREDLLAAADDYDRVFKSRPKIATSPVFSPQKYHPDLDHGEGDGDEVTGIDLGDVDLSDDEFGVEGESPSKGRMRW